MDLDYKKCDPITSYGVLLVYKDEKIGKLQYLLSQRRDSIEYIDFLKGKYTIVNLKHLLSLITVEEKERILNNSFDDLWDDLWVNHESYFYLEFKQRAKVKYENNKEIIDTYLKNNNSLKNEPIWGFPKGKKNNKETEINCAFREFKEETNMSIDYLNLLNLPPSIEVFKGSDGKMYSTVYYIAYIDTKIPIKKIKINNSNIRKETISEEISNLKWCSIEYALKLLPPWRQKLIIDTDLKIKNDFKR